LDSARPLSPTQASGFRPDIEGLRALAVLSVVGFHYGVWGLHGGFVGVDVFFVISGYLITGLLIAELAATGRIDLLRFYGRRARRLLPAALLVTAVILVAGALFLSPLEQLPVAKAGAASSVYLSNFWFMRLTFDYFSPESALNPFLHTWSLSVEEQFYFLWPTLLLFARKTKDDPRAATTVMAVVTIVSFGLCLWLTRAKQPWAFYASPARAWEFGIGGLASLNFVTQWARRSIFTPAIGWLGAVLVIASCFVLDDTSLFPGPAALLPVAATAGILVSGVVAGRSSPTIILGTKPFQWVGARSYSIYLWHWPIIVFATILYPSLSIWGGLGCIALTLACSTASYKFLERPIRKSGWLSSQAKRSIGLGAGLTLTGAGIAALFAYHFSRSPTQRMIETATGEVPTASSQGCLSGFTDAKPTVCSFGTTKPTRTIVLFGDSHADELSTPIIALAQEQNWRIVTYLKASCSVAEIPVYSFRLRRDFSECTQWRATALAEILNLKPDAVIIVQFSTGYIQGPHTGLGEHAVNLATWSTGITKTLRVFDDAEIPVIIIRDTPTPGRNMRVCLARADWRNTPLTDCEIPRPVALLENVANAERHLAETFKRAHFIDVSFVFCDPTICPPILDNTIVYRDANHLTTSYSIRLLVHLRSALLPLL
jgi:peptidoglycan/LPS O-acetylase OafA/YrhL